MFHNNLRASNRDRRHQVQNNKGRTSLARRMELIATGCDRHQDFTQIQTRSEMKEKGQESIFQQKHSRGRHKGIGTTESLNKTQHFWFLLTCCCGNRRLVHKTKVSALFLSLHIEGKTYVISMQLSLEPTIAVQTNTQTPNPTNQKQERNATTAWLGWQMFSQTQKRSAPFLTVWSVLQDQGASWI